MYRHLGKAAGKLIPLLTVVAKFLFRATELILKSMVYALKSLIIGIPESVDQTVKMWRKELLDKHNLPTRRMKAYSFALGTISVLFILVGWLCLSFTTVYLVMLLFR